MINSDKKGSNFRNSLKIGDVVLINTYEKCRTFWPMGKIENIYYSCDAKFVQYKSNAMENCLSDQSNTYIL